MIDLSSSSSSSSSSSRAYSEAELNDVVAATIQDIQGFNIILSARNVSVIQKNLPKHIQLSSEWIMVVVIPADDYFSSIQQSEKKTVGLGVMSFFFALLLLYFARLLVPDLNLLKRKAEMQRAKELKELEMVKIILLFCFVLFCFLFYIYFIFEL